MKERYNKNKHNMHYELSPNGKKVLIVYCIKQGGSFSSELWFLGKVPYQLCPCCREIIK